MHTKRESPYTTKEYAVSGAAFEELHRSTSALQRWTSYICWTDRVEKIDEKKSTPQKFTAEAKLFDLVLSSEEIDCSDGSQRLSEDVAFI